MAHMSLGFVNGAHRSAKDATSRQFGARPRHPPSLLTSDEAHASRAGAVVPVVEPTAAPTPKNDVQMPSDRNTLERRHEYLAAQCRELYETVTTLQSAYRSSEASHAQQLQGVHSKLETLETLEGRTTQAAPDAMGGLFTIRGECVDETPQFADRAGQVGETLAPLAKGTPVVLAYPMTSPSQTGSPVYMRLMNVDPHTASVAWTWVLLYAKEGGRERVYVSKFTPP